MDNNITIIFNRHARRGSFVLLFSFLSLFLFFSCRNPFVTPDNHVSDEGNNGLVHINIGEGDSTARTVQPSRSSIAGYQLTFSGTGTHTPVDVTEGSSADVYLTNGTWKITATAYKLNGTIGNSQDAVASGYINVVISGGTVSGMVPPILLTQSGNVGNGTLNYSITAGAGVTGYMKLWGIDGGNPVSTFGNAGMLNISNSVTNNFTVAAGRYIVEIKLTRTDGNTAFYRDVIEIWEDTTTGLVYSPTEFSDPDMITPETTIPYGVFNVTTTGFIIPNISYTGGVLNIIENGSYDISMKSGITSTTTDMIKVTSGVSADITMSNVNIDMSSTSNACAFDMTGATVSLTLSGDNVLKSGNNMAGFEVPDGSSLTITAESTGLLTVTGGSYGAGIGGGYNTLNTCGNINILGGTITATGGSFGAGIGGAAYGGGGLININNCTITATGGTSASGIGGGYNGLAGNINSIIGNAIVFASSIQPDLPAGGNLGPAIIFIGNNSSMYGNVTLKHDVTLAAGRKLIIPAGQNFTIPYGITLYNNGLIYYFGDISISGNIIGNQPFSSHTFFDNFEYTDDNALNASPWSTTGNVTVTTQTAVAPTAPYFGNYTKFLMFRNYTINGEPGTSVLERQIYPTEASALSFNIKTEIENISGQYFKIYVNGVEKGSWNGETDWNNVSILLDAGQQTIRFEYSTANWLVSGMLNAVFIDDISLIPDTTDSIEIHPRGQLNTYVGVPENEKIQFNAIAYRSDGSVRKNATDFVYSGNSVNSSTGVLTPSTAGTTTVSVSQGGKSASTNVTVHPADYMRQPYYYPGTGKIYNGFSGTTGTRTTGIGGVTTTYPSETSFSADGFFTLEGSVNNSAVNNYAYIEITKDSDPSVLKTYYFVKDDFEQRIWLRFGPGAYTINVYGMSGISLTSQGAFVNWGYWTPGITFNVTNTHDDGLSIDGSNPDRRFIYPSYIIQSDDFRITNLVSDLTYGLTDDTVKTKAIHKYIIGNTIYDYDSLIDSQRKMQDALTVIGTRYHINLQYDPDGHFLAVCEGYANLYSALMRAAGFETKYILSPDTAMNHAWNNVYINGSWKFVDTTWDDPNPDTGPDSLSYSYFLLNDLNGISNDHYGWAPDMGRIFISDPVPKQRGVPDGWY